MSEKSYGNLLNKSYLDSVIKQVHESDKKDEKYRNEIEKRIKEIEQRLKKEVSDYYFKETK